jgi:antitoxin VapB
MAINIKSPEVDGLARELAKVTGETITEAIRISLEERLQREKGRRRARRLRDDLAAIRARSSRLPVLDTRTEDETLGYDRKGLPS